MLGSSIQDKSMTSYREENKGRFISLADKLSLELKMQLQVVYSDSGGYSIFPAKTPIPAYPLYGEIEQVYVTVNPNEETESEEINDE